MLNIVTEKTHFLETVTMCQHSYVFFQLGI